MKTALTILFLAASATAATAQYSRPYGNSYGSYGSYGTGSNPNSNYVAPHVNRSGEFTPGHHRTNPNSTTLDNYGTSGNVNPFTGQAGTRRASPW